MAIRSIEELRNLVPAPPSDKVAADGVRCMSADPTKYYDPRDQRADAAMGGVSTAAGMCRSGAVIVPRGSDFGGSQGYDPYKPAVLTVYDVEGGTKTPLDLGRLTAGKMKVAEEIVSSKLGPRPTDRDGQARYAQAVCRVLDAISDEDVEEPPAQPQPQPQPQPQAQPASAPRGGLASVFGDPPPRTATQAMPSIASPQRATQSVKVTFAVPGFGEVTASYRYAAQDVMADQPVLILGWDQYDEVAFVPKTADGSSMVLAVLVDGSDDVLKVESNNMIFRYRGDVVCVLFIMDRRSYKA